MRKVIALIVPVLALAVVLWASGVIPKYVTAAKEGTVYRYHQAVSAAAWPYIGLTTELNKGASAINSLDQGFDKSTRVLQRRSVAEDWWSWSVQRRYRYLRDNRHAMIAGKALLAALTLLVIFFSLKFFRRWIMKVLGLPLLAYAAYRKQQPTDAHGSAKWAERDAYKSLSPVGGEPQFVVGSRAAKHRFSRKEVLSLPLLVQNMHVIVVGPPGTMKTNATILRNLLCERGDRSVVITDYKGELREKAFGYLNEVFGGRVYVYDPYDPRFDRYNPLHFINNVTDAQRFAKSVITNTGESKDEPFWQNINQAMIVGAVMHLKHGGGRVPLPVLANFLSRPIQDIVKDYETSRNDVARERAHYMLNEIRTNEKLRASVTSELTIRWDWLLEPAVRVSSSENTIPLNELSTEPMCVFLMLNAEKSETLRPLMSNMWAHIFSNIAANARAEIDGRFLSAGGIELPQGRGQKQTAFYLDEFTNIGIIPHFSDHLKTVRSARASLFLVVQTLAGIDDLYGRGMWEQVYEACATKIVLGGTSGKDAEFISRELGNTTVVTRSSTRSRRTSELVRGQAGHTLAETRRALLEAIEIRERMDELVVITAGKQSMLIEKDPYFRHADLVRRTKRPYALERFTERKPPDDPGLKWHPIPSNTVARQDSHEEASTDELTQVVLGLQREGKKLGEIAGAVGVQPSEVLYILQNNQARFGSGSSHKEIGPDGNLVDVEDQFDIISHGGPGHE